MSDGMQPLVASSCGDMVKYMSRNRVLVTPPKIDTQVAADGVDLTTNATQAGRPFALYKENRAKVGASILQFHSLDSSRCR
eukprot:2199494-Amphidinium_carterae.1